MERLNRTSAPQAKKYTEKVIQFGEGNFLRAFIEWIIWKTNQKTDFNGSVVVVQPIEKAAISGRAATPARIWSRVTSSISRRTVV